MKLQRVNIVILAMLLAACTPGLQPPVTPTPPPVDFFTPTSTLSSAATPTPTLSPLPTSTTTATSLPIFETGLPPSPTSTPNATEASQQADIKQVIQAYFELRYQLLSVSPPSDIRQDVFEEFVSGGEAAKDFLALETAKLAMERNWYELRGLRYAKYEYDLKYTDISFDASAQVVTVSVLDNFKIVRERTIESNPENPSVTWGDLRHEIVLRNEQGQWKIISDTYWDAGWREFRKPGLSTSEILQKIRAKMQGQETTPSPTP